MNHRIMARGAVILGLAWLAVALVCAGLALAQGGYDLPWWTMDGGGGTSSGGGYSVSGTVGQADPGSQPLSGGSYTVQGGFWSGAGEASSGHRLNLPLVLR